MFDPLKPLQRLVFVESISEYLLEMSSHSNILYFSHSFSQKNRRKVTKCHSINFCVSLKGFDRFSFNQFNEICYDSCTLKRTISAIVKMDKFKVLKYHDFALTKLFLHRASYLSIRIHQNSMMYYVHAS